MIAVFHRRVDNSIYWKEIARETDQAERRLPAISTVSTRGAGWGQHRLMQPAAAA
jgi:hypothetical protein